MTAAVQALALDEGSEQAPTWLPPDEGRRPNGWRRLDFPNLAASTAVAHRGARSHWPHRCGRSTLLTIARKRSLRYASRRSIGRGVKLP